MTNTELLAALGKLRGQVAQMTDAPWANETTNYQPLGYPRALIHFGDGFKFNTVIAPNVLGPDAAGIAALRNAADELLAAAEALIGTHPSNRGPWCWCGYGRDVQNCGHGPQCKTARAALDRLAKKLEAANK